MSNNKQSMKLYTEEQILKFLEHKIIFDSDDLDELTPIELPSDDEIERKIKHRLDKEFMVCSVAFRDGAQWMRNKIQGGNK